MKKRRRRKDYWKCFTKLNRKATRFSCEDIRFFKISVVLFNQLLNNKIYEGNKNCYSNVKISCNETQKTL